MTTIHTPKYVAISQIKNVTERHKQLDLTFSENPLVRLSYLQENLTQEELPLLTHPITTIESPHAYAFGDKNDGVIELAAFTHTGGAIELGYYYGVTKPKSIIKISSQIGCPAACTFCNAGQEKFIRNLSVQEMYEQVALVAQLIDQYKIPTKGVPHKINFAGTGEPLLNDNLNNALVAMSVHAFSFKISTVMPRSKVTANNFERLAKFASSYSSSVQLQISLISTSEEYRRSVAGIALASFDEIRDFAALWRSYQPKREQVNLSLIISEETPADTENIFASFPPEHFRFRFRNYIKTDHGDLHALNSVSEERMLNIKAAFRARGYYVTDDATPTPTEMEFNLASNVTRRRMMVSLGMPIEIKKKFQQ